MHANDIATMTTEAGNELYDIETGSAVTYPCPMRFVSFTSETVGETRTVEAAIDTVTNLDNITYLTANKEEATIDDLTEYAKQPQFGLSEGVITNLGTGVVDGLLDTVQAAGFGPTIDGLLASLLGMDVTLDTAIDLIAALVGEKPEDPEVAADTTAWKDSKRQHFCQYGGRRDHLRTGASKSLSISSSVNLTASSRKSAKRWTPSSNRRSATSSPSSCTRARTVKKTSRSSNSSTTCISRISPATTTATAPPTSTPSWTA